MQYTFARSQTVTWQPQFTYMGFRYALGGAVAGKTGTANFTACVLHSTMQPGPGEFTCSEPLVNQLNHNILWGLKSNFLDVPTIAPNAMNALAGPAMHRFFARPPAGWPTPGLFTASG